MNSAEPLTVTRRIQARSIGTLLSLPRVFDGCSSGNLDEMGLVFRLGKLNYPAPALTAVASAVVLRSTMWRRGLFF